MNISATLRRITETPKLHAAFLNSLAYLEYRGFRKIVRSHTTEQMSLEVLLHAAEEVRHAVFFKRQAVKLGGSAYQHFSEETLVAEAALKNYFYEIDAQVEELAVKTQNKALQEAVYYLVTWMVEVRATAIYEEYEKILSKAALGFSLNGILREESLHLAELGAEAKRILKEQGFVEERVLQIEEREFAKLWGAIEAACDVRAHEAML